MSVASAARSQSELTPVAWVPQGDIDLAEWSRIVQRLGAIDRCSPWWIGDCLRYGNAKFGEKYTRAVKLTGYDVQTLMNRVYVASHIEISRRRENLSWSHHDAVASLDADQQDRWLDLAGEQKMSVADLRLELRARRQTRNAPPPADIESADGLGEGGVVMACPNCGHRIPCGVVAAALKEPSAIEAFHSDRDP